MRTSLAQALKETDSHSVDRILARQFFVSSERPHRPADVVALPKRDR
jgi:hypothetical protein